MSVFEKPRGKTLLPTDLIFFVLPAGFLWVKALKTTKALR